MSVYLFLSFKGHNIREKCQKDYHRITKKIEDPGWKHYEGNAQ